MLIGADEEARPITQCQKVDVVPVGLMFETNFTRTNVAPQASNEPAQVAAASAPSGLMSLKPPRVIASNTCSSASTPAARSFRRRRTLSKYRL
jgi:hypothetical protein